MFKPERPEFVNKTFRFKKDLLEELQIYASQNNISVNELVVQCCQYAMQNKVTTNKLEDKKDA